jgi:TonB family protein
MTNNHRTLPTLVLVAALPLVPLYLYAQNAGGSITGHVEDPSGARVPNCSVTAKNLDGKNEETATCNATGQYKFAAIPPGHYSLTINARGFKVTTMPMMVTPGVTATADAILELGSIMETINVVATKPGGGFGRSNGAAAEKVRIGGSVTPAMLLNGPKPVYPPDLHQSGVEGSVTIRAVVSTEGKLLNPRVVNTVTNPAFSDAALEAVSHWRFKPSELNGQPVEVSTTITVNFTLEQ